MGTYTRRVLILMGCLFTQMKLQEQSQGYQIVSKRFFSWVAGHRVLERSGQATAAESESVSVISRGPCAVNSQRDAHDNKPETRPD